MIETMNQAAIHREWVGSHADGKFPLLEWLGGSQEVGVFLTERNEQSQKAILKLFLADAGDVATRVAAWDAAKALSHPNLMKVYEHGRCQIDDVDCIYVVTEFADEVLSEILSGRPLTTEETRDLLGPALDALSYLHAKGLVHSRLKPSNIMAAGDHLKLSADGLSFAGAAARPGLAPSAYAAPETETGFFGPASDLWSLGATLVEVLTKYPPDWNRARAAEPAIPESMPEPFAAIARKCLRSDPARRISIEAIRARLEPARSLPPPQEIAKEASAARRPVALLIAAATLLLAAIGIWAMLSHRRQSPSAAPEAQIAPPPAPVQSPVPAPAPTAAPNKIAVPAPAPPQPAAETSVAPPASNPAPSPASPAAIPPSPSAAQPQVDQTPAPGSESANRAIVTQILPDIVPSAMKTISGTLRVSVRLSVDANGNVTGATLESPGPSKYFAGKALDASRHWRFKPAQVDGQAAPSEWIVEFQFKQSGIFVVPERTAP